MEAKKSSAQVIGSLLAIIQTFFDDLLTILFKRMKKFGDEGDKPSESIQDKAVDLAKKSAGFFGEIGDEYYTTYAKLKAKRHHSK